MIDPKTLKGMSLEDKLTIHRKALEKMAQLADLVYEEAWDRGWVYNDLKTNVLKGKYPPETSWGKFCRGVLQISKSEADIYINIVLASDPRAEFDRCYRLANEKRKAYAERQRRLVRGSRIYQQYVETTAEERLAFHLLLEQGQFIKNIYDSYDRIERTVGRPGSGTSKERPSPEA